MQKAYPDKIDWENYPSTNTALNADNLNNMSNALDVVDTRVVGFDITKANQADMDNAVINVEFDDKTGIFTFTKNKGQKFTIDTLLEKVVTNWNYNEQTQKLEITLQDGTKKEVDLSSMITNYDFQDSTEINFTIQNGKVKANVLNGSITESKLQPNFLADIRISESNAKQSETTAIAKALVSEGYANGTQNGIPVTEGEYFKNNAKFWKDQAQAIATGSIGGLSDVEIVNPTDKQALVYDASTQTWVNGTSGTVMSTESQHIEGTLEGSLQLLDCARNLIPYPYLSGNQTLSGVTFTFNADGSVHAKGTASATITLSLANQSNMSYADLVGKKLTLSGCTDNQLNNVGMEFYAKPPQIWQRDYGSGITFDMPSSPSEFRVAIFIRSGTTVDTIFYPMLEEGAVAHDYVPYAGYIIKTCNRNLIPFPYTDGMSKTSLGVTFSVNSDGSITANGTSSGSATYDLAYPIVLPKGRYKISGIDTNSSYFILLQGIVGSSVIKTIGSTRSGQSEFNIDYNGYDSIRISCRVANTTANNLVFKPMLEYGEVSHEFEVQKTSSVDITKDTKLPLMLDAYKGVTNILSPSYTKVNYALNESGKGLLDAIAGIPTSNGMVEILVDLTDESLIGSTIRLEHRDTAESHTHETYEVVSTEIETIFNCKNVGWWDITVTTPSGDVFTDTVEADFYGFYHTTIGGDIHINVTYDDSFVGSVFHLTNGDKVYNKTATSAGGTLSWIVNEEGDWTVWVSVGGTRFELAFNNVQHGQTYSDKMYAILDGATALPINDISKWLMCSVDTVSVKYTTLAQVLADTTVLNTLLGNENANKYLIRSTGFATDCCANEDFMTYLGLKDDALVYQFLNDETWLNAICNSQYFESILTKSVPVMTSDTSPQGRAFATDTYSTNNPYKAFDKDTGTRWLSNTTVANSVDLGIGYIFVEPIICKLFKFTISSNAPISEIQYTIQGSNDGSNWTDLTEKFTDVPKTEFATHIIDNNVAYSRYRMHITKQQGSTTSTRCGYMNVMNFYGR